MSGSLVPVLLSMDLTVLNALIPDTYSAKEQLAGLEAACKAKGIAETLLVSVRHCAFG